MGVADAEFFSLDSYYGSHLTGHEVVQFDLLANRGQGFAVRGKLEERFAFDLDKDFARGKLPNDKWRIDRPAILPAIEIDGRQQFSIG